MKKAIILLSGGMDSATCCALAKKRGFSLYAMTFSYGQRHACELGAAKKIAKQLGVAEHKIVKIDLRIFGGSSLTSAMKVPKNRGMSRKSAREIPNTYVPARNTIFLSYALAWAEVLGSNDIFIGVNAVDYSGYPDCRPAFIAAFEKMAKYATKAGISGRQVKIHTPLISLSKPEIIRTGLALGVDYRQTHSCYDPSTQGLACGTCDSCILRKRGFAQAGIPDPTRYKNKKSTYS